MSFNESINKWRKKRGIPKEEWDEFIQDCIKPKEVKKIEQKENA